MTNFEDSMNELAAVQQKVAEALVRARELAVLVKGDLPELEEFEETPTETLLRQMVEAKEAAVEDRKQVALLVALIDRLQVTTEENATGIQRIEDAAAMVAGELLASQERADAVEAGVPGEASDAGMKSPSK